MRHWHVSLYNLVETFYDLNEKKNRSKIINFSIQILVILRKS